MRIQTEYMSFKTRWMISSSYDFQVHQQRSQTRCRFPDCFTVIRAAPRLVAGALRCTQACHRGFQTSPRLSQVLPGAPTVLFGAPRCSQSHQNLSHGTLELVIRDPSYSKGHPECPPSVWYSPEFDAYKFTLHILSGTPGVFQWLK